MSSVSPRKPSGKELLVLLGVVSLFADLCYEGMRSAVGPYLALLGASATAVGFVSGLGELIGYGLRYATGALADRTGRYWLLTFLGYGVNLVAVPLLAVAPNVMAIAALVALERLGKAIRSPAKSTLTSFAVTELGAGKGFAIHEAMDQFGAVVGPLAVAGVLAWRGHTVSGFAWAFALLIIPAIVTMLMLGVARARFPDPRSLGGGDAVPEGGLSRDFRWYLIGIALIALGLADWPLLSFHLQKTHTLPTTWLPIVYAGAMAADALAALAVGWRFDVVRARGGSSQRLLALCMLIGAGFAPLVFLGTRVAGWLPLAGVLVWAATLAATESIAKATVATLVSSSHRGRAYGIYYLVFGVAWWLGSVAMGALYDVTPALSAAFCTSALVAAAAVLALPRRGAP